MKAAVVHSFDQPLALEDVPVPTAGPEQVLVRIEACGLCHTDIHAARGEWPVKPSPPFIPGHEGVGIIERLGTGNPHGLQEGMRVALPWLGYACGDCRYCNSGAETLCESQINTGYGMNGGFAEYAVGYARHVVRVPDDVDPLDAAPLTCAGVTTYKAVKVSGASSAGSGSRVRCRRPRPPGDPIRQGDGRGGRRGRHQRGATEHRPRAGRRACRACGRTGSRRCDPGTRRSRPGDPTAVTPSAFEQALGSLARGGTLVCVGLPAQNEMRLPIFQTVLGGLTVKGRSSAPTTTSRRYSSCTAADARRSSTPSASSTTSTTRSDRCSTAALRHLEWSSACRASQAPARSTPPSPPPSDQHPSTARQRSLSWPSQSIPPQHSQHPVSQTASLSSKTAMTTSSGVSGFRRLPGATGRTCLPPPRRPSARWPTPLPPTWNWRSMRHTPRRTSGPVVPGGKGRGARCDRRRDRGEPGDARGRRELGERQAGA